MIRAPSPPRPTVPGQCGRVIRDRGARTDGRACTDRGAYKKLPGCRIRNNLLGIGEKGRNCFQGRDQAREEGGEDADKGGQSAGSVGRSSVRGECRAITVSAQSDKLEAVQLLLVSFFLAARLLASLFRLLAILSLY